MTAAALDLTQEQRRLVVDILDRTLPAGSSVWAFGSRATGRARASSDLDFAVDAGTPLTLDHCGLLREAFEESALPYRVDIVDWRALGEPFRALIAAHRILLTGAPPILGTATSR